MQLAIVFGLVLFVVFALALLLLLGRSSAQSALLEEVTRDVRGMGTTSPLWRSAVSSDSFARPFTAFRRFFASEPNPEIVRRLLLAGYRKPHQADIFIGSRLAVPAVLGLTVTLIFSQNTVFIFLLALVLGFFVPDFWLGRATKRRREQLRLSLPDGLDLLSICLEAGLGLDQGIVRVGQELRVSHPALSEELLQINFEQRAGSPRIAAWKSFAERADTESVRSFVAMLVQTDRFGTPISKSLGNFSEALRTQRRQKAEEMAAKTTIKLVPPLVFFIFPSIGIVTVLPAVITVMQNIGHIVD